MQALQSDTTDFGLQLWGRDVNVTINTELQRGSVFSGPTPNSAVTAAVGTFLTNLAPRSAGSRLWFKTDGSSNTGWTSLL